MPLAPPHKRVDRNVGEDQLAVEINLSVLKLKRERRANEPGEQRAVAEFEPCLIRSEGEAEIRVRDRQPLADDQTVCIDIKIDIDIAPQRTKEG